MARHKIDTVGARSKLEPRREPYWMPISDMVGAAVGYRRGPDTWIARLTDDIADKKVYHALGKFSDHREAVKTAREWIKSKERGVVAFDKTVRDACLAYIANIRAEKGAKPAQEAEARLRRQVLGRVFKTREIPPNGIALVPLRKLRPHHLESFRNALLPVQTEGSEVLDSERMRKARASANREMTILIAALNYACRMRMCASDDAWATLGKFADTQAPKTSRRIVSLADRKRLLATAQGAIRDFLEGLILTGARPIELCRLKVTDFEPRTARLTLTSYKGRGSEPRRRTIPLRAMAGAEPLLIRLCKNRLPSTPIFTRDDGRHWSHGDWDEAVQDVRSAAGLPYLTAYDLRHSWITEALNSGVDTSTVAEIAGTSITMLSKTYAHLIDSHAVQAFASVRFV